MLGVFLGTLFPKDGGGLIEVRALPSRERAFIPRDRLASLGLFLSAHREENCYFGVAARRDTTSGELKNCARLAALFVDIDFKTTPEPEARARLTAFPHPSSILVHSGGGLHAYWLLVDALDVQQEAPAIRGLLRRLAHQLGGDLGAAEPARILRLPGTLNYKYTPPPVVAIERFDPERHYYDPGELAAALPPEPETDGWPADRASREAERTPGPTPPEVLRRARAYVAAVPPAIEGQHGDDHTFQLSCKLVLGFGLTERDAFDVLQEWNERCVPPWSARELAEKIGNAIQYGKEPPNGRRDAPRPDRRDPDDACSDGEDEDADASAAAPSTPVEIEMPVAEQAAEEPYWFAPPVSTGHWLADYIVYAAERTDAAHEYHEAVGLFLLATAMPGVKARLRQFAAGLAANLYLLLIGPSTVSRRSTSTSYGTTLLEAVIPDVLLPDLTTPEAFLEQLAARSGRAAAWYVDEMTDLIEKFTNAKFMTGLRSALLQGYDGRDFRYARHSKRKKDGTHDEDVDWVRDPHLNVVGNATDSLFKTLTLRDLTSGFLPRFAVVMPKSKPPRRPFEEAPETLDAMRTELAKRLHDLWTWADTGPRRATFAPGSLAALDQAAAQMERENEDLPEQERIILRRADARLLKLALLMAGGRLDLDRDDLLVTTDDVTAATTVATRWRTDAIAFASRIGESDFERHVGRCSDLLRKKKQLPRRVIAQHLHLEKAVLDRIRATLADRGEIEIDWGRRGGQGQLQAPETWVWTGRS